MDRVSETTSECWSAIHQLRAAGDDGRMAGDQIHRQFVAYLDKLKENARDAGLDERDATDIQYALAALADEIALSKSEAIRSFWYGRPLQMHFFKENVAGEGFFKRLQALRGDRRRLETLRVYYLCLLFGFQGRYAIGGGELELARLQESLRDELERETHPARVLSPSGTSEDEMNVRRRDSRFPVWVGLGALAVAMTVYIGLRVMLDRQASGFADEISHRQPLTAN